MAEDLRMEWEEGKLQIEGGRCGHCGNFVAFRSIDEAPISVTTYDEKTGRWQDVYVTAAICPVPSCGGVVVAVRRTKPHESSTNEETEEDRFVWPIAGTRPPLPPEVPSELRRIYQEASSIEDISPNGAAFLARRILEQVLREKLESRKPLAVLIDRFLEQESGVPGHLHEMMHDVREFGNIAGHPDQGADGEWLDVEPGEASYTLGVTAELLDFLYIRPARQLEMRARLRAKRGPRT